MSLHVCSLLSRSVTSDSVWPRGLQPTRLVCPWDSPGKNTGVGCHALLQGIFPTRNQAHVSCVSCVGSWVPSPVPLGKPSVYCTSPKSLETSCFFSFPFSCVIQPLWPLPYFIITVSHCLCLFTQLLIHSFIIYQHLLCVCNILAKKTKILVQYLSKLDRLEGDKCCDRLKGGCLYSK